MIEVAQGQPSSQAIAATAEVLAAPDAARTQEAVEQHGNVQVVQQVVPGYEPSQPAANAAYGEEYANAAVKTLEPEAAQGADESLPAIEGDDPHAVDARDDLGPLNPPDADGWQTFAPIPGAPDSEGLLAEPDAVSDAPVAGDVVTDGQDIPVDELIDENLVEPEGRAPENAAPANVNVRASNRNGRAGVGIDWTKTVTPPAEGEERIVTPKGVDLTRLTHFNEERSARPPKKSKPRRPEGEQRPQQRQPAPKPALLRSAGSQNYLRDALGLAKVEDKDGVHHINTSVGSETKLGRMLSMNAYVPFDHPDLGMFNSVGGLWYFVGMKEPRDDIFRTLHGAACRQRGAHVQMREVVGFRSIIADATWIKVNSDENLKKMMTENTLPYQCYFLTGELQMRQSPPMAVWYVPVLEEIGRVLRVNAQRVKAAADETERLRAEAVAAGKSADDAKKDVAPVQAELEAPDFEFLERRQPQPQRREYERRDNRPPREGRGGRQETQQRHGRR